MTADPYVRRGLPERWLLPPPPRQPHLRRRWEELPFDERLRLARLSPEELPSIDVEQRELITALASARIATAWRLFVAAALIGWLVLMTIWGFGRSTAPNAQQVYLYAGLGLGGAAWAAASFASVHRLRKARRLLRR